MTVKYNLNFVSCLLMLTFRNGQMKFSEIIIVYTDSFKLLWENTTYTGVFVRAKHITHKIKKEPFPYSQHRT